MNIALFIFRVFIYLVSIILIALKLRNILKNPHKYEETDLEDRANERIRKKRFCRFFQSLSHQYSMVFLLFFGGLLALNDALIYINIRIIAQDNMYILPSTRWIGVLAMLFLNIIFGMVIVPLKIKTTFFAVAVRDMFNGSRYDIWKKGYIMFLVLFIIAYPFFALSCNNYIYYNDNGITSSGYFEIGDTYTSYEDIEEIWISVHYDKQEQASSLNYKIKSNGKLLELCTNDYFDEKTLDVHKKIEIRSNCNVNIEPLTEEDILYLTEELPKEQVDIIKYIFEGFHRY